MRARHLYVKQQAEQILNTPGIKNPDGRVDVKKLCDALGIKAKPELFEDGISGLAIKDGVRDLIFFNSKESPEEQNFSIAHEIGHHKLHTWKAVQVSEPLQVRYLKKEENKDVEEEEADLFASILLIPEADLRLHFKVHSQKTKDFQEVVTKLAEHFCVTKDAMQMRLTLLDLKST